MASDRRLSDSRLFFCANVCLACALVFGTAGAEQPNVVLILADDMGYGDASCYWKSPPCKTPNLDNLAQQGMRFTDFHSSGNVCSPTRAGLMTGRYQQRAGIPGVIDADPNTKQHAWALQHQETTFAELLAKNGYRTALFGKWHLGYDVKFNPTTHGFGRFRGFVSGNIDYISHYDRMETYDWWAEKKLIQEKGYTTHLITKHAVEFINENKDKPFCLYVAHAAVHAPWQGPDDSPQRGPKKKKTQPTKSKDAALKEMLTELDKSVGEILKSLKENKIDQKTFVFFCSDNGPAGGSAGPLRGRKGSDWEGGHRVPAIAYWPGKIPAGKTSEHLGITLDLMPTVLDVCEVECEGGHRLDGISLASVLTGGPPNRVRQLFWNGVAMRDGNWKLMSRGNGLKGPALYDLSNDISERSNLAEQYPERVQKMMKSLERWKQDVETGSTSQD